MSGSDHLEAPDDELRELVSRLVDRNLNDAESRRLEERLRDDPQARDYCARSLHFDASLQEAIHPRPLEWEETRRVVFDPRQGPAGFTVQRQQTLRYGDRASTSPRGRHRRWWLVGGIFFATIVALLTVYSLHRHSVVFQLRNGDFEAMDLSQSATGTSSSILYWQDNFFSGGVELCEPGRTTGGRIFAKSGRNAVKMSNRSFLTQLILNRGGTALQAKPGTRVVVRGWSFCDVTEPQPLRASLRYVASGYPAMLQYEAAHTTVDFPAGGWHPFRFELVISDDLTRSASDVGLNTPSPPTLDITGRQLNLSLDRLQGPGAIYLDDLEIHVAQEE